MFGFRGLRCWKGPSASAVFTIGGRVVDEWWDVKGFAQGARRSLGRREGVRAQQEPQDWCQRR